MNKPLLSTAIILCAGLNAQKTNNFGVGISPFGLTDVKMEYKKSGESDKMKIDYKSYINAHIFYERQFGGAGFLVEGTYAMLKTDKVDKNIINFYDVDATFDKDVNIYSAAFYGSYAINRQKRLQIPLYLGVSADYFNGNPVNMLFVSLAAKVRLKFYVTNKIAVYGGYNYRTGIGMEAKDKGSSSSKPERTTTINMNYADMGVTFSF